MTTSKLSSGMEGGRKIKKTITLLVVEPTHLKNMRVKMEIFPNFRDANKKYLSYHHPVTNSTAVGESSTMWARKFPSQYDLAESPCEIDTYLPSALISKAAFFWYQKRSVSRTKTPKNMSWTGGGTGYKIIQKLYKTAIWTFQVFRPKNLGSTDGFLMFLDDLAIKNYSKIEGISVALLLDISHEILSWWDQRKSKG